MRACELVVLDGTGRIAHLVSIMAAKQEVETRSTSWVFTLGDCMCYSIKSMVDTRLIPFPTNLLEVLSVELVRGG